MQDPGFLRRRVLQPADLGLPLHRGRGEAGPSPWLRKTHSEASEWELRERGEMEEERRQEAEEPGAGDEEQPIFLPTPSFMASAEEG